MKNKLLALVLLACIGLNIYQFNITSNIRNSLSSLTEIENNLTSDIESKTQDLSNLTDEIKNNNTQISELTSNINSLTESTEALQAEIDILQLELNTEQSKADTEQSEVKETTSSIDIDAIADQIYQDLIKEHPEWVAGGGTTYTQGDYEHVGTPDSGEFENPDYEFGKTHSDVPPGIVY